MIEFTIGILGAGWIAAKVAETIQKLGGMRIGAIAARSEEKAKEFADKYDIPKAYGSYEELLADPEIELVYVATINSNHALLAKNCIDAGKPVLVEKPFSYNAATATKVFQYARDKKVFCGEAMWTRYVPLIDRLREVLAKKTIGPVRYVESSLGYNLRDRERLLRPDMAGGALLDLGIYTLNIIVLAMGCMPASMASSMVPVSTGVDGMETIQLTFPRGQGATAVVSMMTELDNRTVIYGMEGRIEIEGTNAPTCLSVFDKDGKLLEEYLPPENQISGYEYEFLAARDAVIIGKPETDQMKHIETLQLLSFMDALRSTWKMRFPLPEEPKPGEKDPNAPIPVRPGGPAGPAVPQGGPIDPGAPMNPGDLDPKPPKMNA